MDAGSETDTFYNGSMVKLRELAGCHHYGLEIAGNHLVLPCDDFTEGQPGAPPRNIRALMADRSGTTMQATQVIDAPAAEPEKRELNVVKKLESLVKN